MRALSVNAPSTSRETFSNSVPDEVGVDLGLLAVEDARADLDRVDEDRRRVGARLLALAHQLPRPRGHGRRGRRATTIAPKTETRGGRSGVAASMTVESHGTRATRQNPEVP